MSEGGHRPWWSDRTPPILERLVALAKVALSGRFDHELRSTIGARPSSRPLGQDGLVQLDIYKIWYVLHYDRRGEDRTTNLYVRKIGERDTFLEKIGDTGIETTLLPVENEGWRAKHGDSVGDPDAE